MIIHPIQNAASNHKRKKEEKNYRCRFSTRSSLSSQIPHSHDYRWGEAGKPTRSSSQHPMDGFKAYADHHGLFRAIAS